MMLKKHTKKITSVFNQCISFCFCISQLFLVDFIFASPPISLPTCSGSPIISCGTNLNRNTDLDSCSAVVNFVSPIGTSPCDGICSATNTTAIHIPDTTVVSSIININSFVAGSTLGGQVSLQSICLDISHAFVGQLNAALVSPSGNGVALFEKPGLGNNGCNGDSLSVCLIPGTGYGLNDTTACGNYPAYSGSYTGSDDLNFLNNGSSANGVWTLYIYDDSVGVEGTLVQWSLHFTTNTITTQTAGLPSGSVFPVGTTTNGFTALDGFGNSSTCSFNIVVTDTQRPKITCVNDTFSSTPTLCGKTGAVFTIPTTSDNCEIASAINNAPAFFPVGNSIVTWTITDIHGNTVSCFETVTVSDIENPMITCPGDVSVNASAGICSVPSVSLGLATASDNCGIDSITNNAPSIFTLGATTILWLVTDVNGNSATCNQTVTVIDNQAPTVSCSANITVNVAANSCGASVVLSNPTYADNCGVASVSNDAPATYFGGTTTVVWTVTDVNGNSSTCNQTVTVTDNIQPLITCPGNISGNTDAGQCTASNVVLGTASVSDNCGVQSLINNAPTIFNSGISTVIWTVTDVHSNSTSCAQTVTVIDNQAPTVSCSANVTVNVAANSCGASVVLSNPTSADNCGVASVLNNAPATYTGGITTVVWTVTDVNGNTSSCNQTVTITDNIQPLITCPGNISGNTDIGQCTA
ncbi:MAG: HYR domain-containing protein [Bacteroidetes bacterium]|nr:HYR domain-containing protein [Bacteroidota bacterium]